MNEEQLGKLEGVVTAAMSPDNTGRAAAESLIYKQFEENREMLVVGLVRLLRGSKSEQVRSWSAIFLRSRLPTGDTTVFDKLPDSVQEGIKTELLQAVLHETSGYVRNLVCDTVAELAKTLLPKEGDAWPAFYPFVFNCATSTNEGLRVSGLVIIGRIAEQTSDILTKQLEPIAKMYGALLQDSSLNVRAVAAWSMLRVCKHTDTSAQLAKFQGFLGGVFNTLAACLNAKNEDLARKVLFALNEVVMEDCKFVRPHLEVLSKAMLGIGTARDLDEGLRKLAMECLSTIAEGRPRMVRKNKGFLQACFNLSFSLMLEVEDDDEGTWAQTPSTPDMFDNSLAEQGELALDRVCHSVGEICLPLIVPLVSEFASRADSWRHRNAAMMAMSQISEEMPFRDIPFKQIVAFTADRHSRVRWTAAHCIGQLALDHAPDFQMKYHEIVIPALLKAMDDKRHPRVQIHAGAALFNFLEQVDEQAETFFPPYVPAALAKLNELLKTAPTAVKEQTLTTIASIAGAAPKQFEEYYDAFMGPCKEIIKNARGKELDRLRSKAMETATSIGLRVGKERFQKDAVELMHMFMAILGSSTTRSDDISHQYLLEACSRICSVIGPEFAVCLPSIMPHVLEAARRTPKWKEAKESEEKTHLEIRISNVDFTEALDDKAAACAMLNSLPHELKEHFAPYVKETAEVMLPLMDFHLHEEVRSYAITCGPELFEATLEAHKKGKVDAGFVKSLFFEITKQQLKCFSTEVDVYFTLLTLVGAFKQMIELAGPLAAELIEPAALKSAADAMIVLLQQSHKRIQARQESLEEDDEDLDEEDLARIQGLNQQEDELNFTVAETVGALIKSHKQSFLPVFNTLVPEFLKMLDPENLTACQKVAVYVFDDVAEFLGPHAAPYYKEFVPALLTYSADEDGSLRQASVYGLGVCAEFGGEAFGPYVDAAIKVLVEGINDPFSRDKKNAQVTDNMIASLGRIATFQNRPDIWGPWLNFLPLTEDKEEGDRVYGFLISQVEKGNPAILGANQSNLPRITTILTGIVGSGFVESQDVKDRIGAFFKGLRSMPEAQLKALGSALPKKLQQKFADILNSAAL